MAAPTLISVAPTPAAIEEAGSEPSVFAIRVVSDSGERAGTAVLLGRERRGADEDLFMVTASELLEPADRRQGRRVPNGRLFVDSGDTRQVDPQHIFLPASGLFAIAVFRVTVPARPAAVRPIVYDTPPAGSVFLIAGFDQAGSRRSVVERVRFESSRYATGDRDASGLHGCIGAPAIGEQGVFGIVTECVPGRAPVITVLSLARTFLDQHIPTPLQAPRSTTQFHLEEREWSGPNLAVACEPPATREVDVPVLLRNNEHLVDAVPRLIAPHEVAVGEATLLTLDDRSIRLRLTMGTDPQPLASAPCRSGQALITLRVRVAVVPRF
jgi:hypothetical protein